MIRRLTVYHQAKGAGTPPLAPDWTPGTHPAAAGPAWQLHTCQRSLWVTLAPTESACAAAARGPAEIEVFQGDAAYHFLLRVATGLASQLAGETNILGQLKSAWNHQARQFPWLQWLFADAKEIRAHFLSDVGGASYGRLVRQMLRSAPGPEHQPILVVGAGDMAESVAPWLRSSPLRILNRTPEKAEALAERLRRHPGGPVDVVAPADADAAWQGARAIVICTPLDPVADPQRIAALRNLGEDSGGIPVIHLGTPRSTAGAWRTLPGFQCLDDLYERQNQADGRRDRQLDRAIQACRERARHRLLGTSLSHPHGWEDLPEFFPETEYRFPGLAPTDFAGEFPAMAQAA